MKPSSRLQRGLSTEQASFLACLATVLELEPAQLPRLDGDEDPANGTTITRWLAGLSMGMARIAEPIAPGRALDLGCGGAPTRYGWPVAGGR